MNKSQIHRWIQNLEIENLNPLQNQSYAIIKDNKNIIILSPTGSGKTLAFLLPVLSKLDFSKEITQVIILSPARELSLQITSVIQNLKTGCKVLCCYGGHSIQVEQNSLLHPPHVIVGTPGRINDLLNKELIKSDGLKFLVLDEFDKALELGFESEIKGIVDKIKIKDGKILTSATPMEVIPDFIKMNKPSTINFLHETTSNSRTLIRKLISDGNDKLDTFFNLICKIGTEPTVAFVNHRDAAERISNHLNNLSIPHVVFHGGLKQEERERALIKFRNGSAKLLLSTDLAARGIDIPDIMHVIHYHLPKEEKSYIHRNGRTARMNADGSVYLILSEKELVPEYISDIVDVYNISTSPTPPELPYWETIYIGYGKKNKVNKIDVVGVVLKNNILEKSELGRIDVLDTCSFIAVPRTKAKHVINQLKKHKIKGKKMKTGISK